MGGRENSIWIALTDELIKQILACILLSLTLPLSGETFFLFGSDFFHNLNTDFKICISHMGHETYAGV